MPPQKTVVNNHWQRQWNSADLIKSMLDWLKYWFVDEILHILVYTNVWLIKNVLGNMNTIGFHNSAANHKIGCKAQWPANLEKFQPAFCGFFESFPVLWHNTWPGQLPQHRSCRQQWWNNQIVYWSKNFQLKTANNTNGKAIMHNINTITATNNELRAALQATQMQMVLMLQEQRTYASRYNTAFMAAITLMLPMNIPPVQMMYWLQPYEG